VKCLEPQPAECFPDRVRRIVLVSALLVVLAWAVPAAASAALTATQIRIANHPAFVRVVVDFSGGTLHSNDTESPDPLPRDGRSRVVVTAPGVTTSAAPLTAEGVRARVVQRSGSVVVKLRARLHRFKYLEHNVLHSPERLVIDLWKARPPTAAAEFPVAPQGGCLSIDQVNGSPGKVVVHGSENDLFEHMFQAQLRNRRGTVIATRPVTAAAGQWHRTLAYSVRAAQAGTLEAVDFSEQDGSLSCIAQVRVQLQPGP
jgi:immunoglobulin-like protein involved in spore germination